MSHGLKKFQFLFLQSNQTYLFFVTFDECILSCQEVLEWVWPSMNRNSLHFIQIQTAHPSMHHNWKEIINIVFETTSGKSWWTNYRQNVLWSWRITPWCTQENIIIKGFWRDPRSIFPSSQSSRFHKPCFSVSTHRKPNRSLHEVYEHPYTHQGPDNTYRQRSQVNNKISIGRASWPKEF